MGWHSLLALDCRSYVILSFLLRHLRKTNHTRHVGYSIHHWNHYLCDSTTHRATTCWPCRPGHRRWWYCCHIPRHLHGHSPAEAPTEMVWHRTRSLGSRHLCRAYPRRSRSARNMEMDLLHDAATVRLWTRHYSSRAYHQATRRDIGHQTKSRRLDRLFHLHGLCHLLPHGHLLGWHQLRLVQRVDHRPPHRRCCRPSRCHIVGALRGQEPFHAARAFPQRERHRDLHLQRDTRAASFRPTVLVSCLDRARDGWVGL